MAVRNLYAAVLSSGVTGRRVGGRPPIGLTAAAVVVALFSLLPLVFIVWQSFSVGAGEAASLVFRYKVAELLGNTLRLTVVVTTLCAAIGLGASWFIERTDLPGRRAWGVVVVLPITIPAFVNSYSWVSLTPAVQGFSGAVIVTTLSYYPLVYLPVAAALRGMDPALEESARSLGYGSWRVFTKVVLPQTKPALLGGALLVALHLLGEFGAFSMLRFNTFTTAIYDQYQIGFNGPAASMLAVVLATLSIVLLVTELKVRGRARYARVGGGAARTLPRRRLGRMGTPLVLIGFVALFVLSLGIPLGLLAYWLARGSSVAFPAASLGSAALASIKLGFGAAALTTVLALPVALLAVRYRGRVSTLIERSTYVARALPGITVALALIVVAIRYVNPVYQTSGLLIAAYAMLFLPLALVSIKAAIAQSPPVLEDVARSLGCGLFTAVRRVTLPLVAPGLGAGAALVFLFTVTELTATLLLSPIGTHTLATEVWKNTTSLAYAAAAPYAALMIAISAPATYLLTRRMGAGGIR